MPLWFRVNSDRNQPFGSLCTFSLRRISGTLKAIALRLISIEYPRNTTTESVVCHPLQALA